MESSRIFVRGLPPNFTEAEFKKHFSNPSVVTDVKFMPKRRIGYVGYKNHNDAEKAVKYFNKSFIRMSRIGVELARPFEEAKTVELKPIPGSPISRGDPTNKRKREDIQNNVSNPKLEEFLEVMQPPSKSKIWANEGVFGIGANDTPLIEVVAPGVEDNASDQEYQPVTKKRKRSSTTVTSEQRQTPPRDDDEQRTKGAENRTSEEGDTFVEETEATVTQTDTNVTTASDADWLRSRTSRLLGLVEDDDYTPTTAPVAEVNEEEKPIRQHPIVLPKATSDAGSQTSEQPSLAVPEAWEDKQKTEGMAVDNIRTGRLFVRNLSYTTSEAELRDHFASYGLLEEVHVAIDPRSGISKGFAYIQFEDPERAEQARSELDGKPFQGRLIHILPASFKRENRIDEYAISKLPIKKQKQIRRKAEAATSIFKWNSMYMNSDAIMSSISNRLGLSKSEILNPTSSDAAIRQAHAETNIIQETKAYFGSHGVNLEAFKKKEFSDSVILVKNFSYGTTSEELRKLFEPHGSLTKLLMPPSGTIAIVQFELPTQARSAFGTLSYRKFKDSVLFLEKAPKGIFNSSATYTTPATMNAGKAAKPSTIDLLEESTEQQPANTSTLFVRNLNFSTTTAHLHDTFQPLNGFLSARVKTKTDPKRPGQVLSMGFGFLEFKTKRDAQSALQAMNGYRLDGHELLIKESHKAVDAAEERRKDDVAKKLAGRRTKVIIKNLPFEATKKDVRALFGSYGQLRSVRVPKKLDSSTRGFAFADFVTAREAENAMDALRDTHLLGRRLVLDFATEDAVDPEEEIEKMQKKVGRQADKVALQKLTGIGRRKFAVEGPNEDE